jgi:3-hydroxyacyl-CoA dehydrogenase/enoyl-CoA hydratase/3-hydroxybutyryl-CoA epimerase
LIDLWEAHGGDRELMQQAEIASFAKLLGTETSRNLIRVFYLRQRLKAAGRGDSRIGRVHVVGAGEMGGDIAAWAAIKGAQVTLFDVENAALGQATQNARRICEEAHLSPVEARDALDRLMPDPRGYGIAGADMVIEAVPEKADLKAKVYDSLSGMKDGAILASNTSSLRLTGLARSAPDGARFAGLHFFNPVPKMQFVEVVRHETTARETIDRLMAFCGDIDRLPACVTDHPGFLVNRALTPYLMEALTLLDEGVARESIDGAALAFGMPMGPIALADQVGLDICLDVAESLRADLDKPLAKTPDWFREKVERGETGKKAGKGLWDWSDGPPRPAAKPDDTLTDRMILPILDACVECLRLGVVSEEDEVDGAMIFATGFAPFRGGPMHYAKSRGTEDIVQQLRRLESTHGPRFAPDEGWGRLVE